MNGTQLIALIALGVSILGYLDDKEHHRWLRERDHM